MKSGSRAVFANFYVAALCGLLAACASPYYLVTSNFVVSDSAEAPPEIVESQTYLSVIPKIKSLAVQPPEGCADETATQSSGEAASQGVLLKTTCGIEMAELERALTQAGFQVISWNVLQNKVVKEEITPSAAAKELGAEVLFQINSLERSLVKAGQDARWERRFYKSNENGEQLKPVALSAQKGNQLLKFVKEKEASTHPERLSVTINASASFVETGETMWFYEWTHAETQGRDEAKDILAVCDDKICQEPPPRKEKNKPEDEQLVSGSSEAISKPKNAEDHQNAFYHQLLRELVTNLAISFKRQL